MTVRYKAGELPPDQTDWEYIRTTSDPILRNEDELPFVGLSPTRWVRDGKTYPYQEPSESGEAPSPAVKHAAPLIVPIPPEIARVFPTQEAVLAALRSLVPA